MASMTKRIPVCKNMTGNHGQDAEVLHGDFGRPTMELLSPMAVMLEGLGFNLCVVPFLNVCVFNLFQRVGAEYVRGGRSWVGGVILESDGRRLRSDHSEDES